MMKLELKPYFEDGEQRAVFNAKHAGCSKDGLLAWVYSDSLLEIFLPDSNEIVASWRFGKVVHDKNTKISCVTDIKYQGGHVLLVATANSSDQGTLSFFSISKRKVIRAVKFPQRITALELLFTNLYDDIPSWIMSHHLNFFCGLVAVGTKGGYVYLTDLCLDELMNHTTEAEPKKLSVTGANIVDPRTKRDCALSHNKHMAVILDDQSHCEEEFHYRRQDDSIQRVFDEDEVHITSLKYLSQTGILAIGFNFGCFQLWRLHGPALDYSSRYQPDTPAVSHFILHEPENDPRKLLYLWIGLDNSILEEEEDSSDSIARISLFQLCFCKKDFYPNFGFFYEDLESVFFWMDHVLSLDPYSSETRGIWSSRLINAYTISNPLYTPLPTRANDSFEEGMHSHDQSLSVFVWKVNSKQGIGTSHHWMAIFDLNRWYHAYMPHSIRLEGSAPQVCTYWAAYRLDDVASCSSPPAILDVQITGDNVVRFMSSSSLPPVEHSYPSALELSDVKFISRQRIVQGHCYGWQGQILQNLVHDGANYLTQPNDFFHQCHRARLVPQLYDGETSALSVERKRQALLNLSLDYRFTPILINQCVELWADGDYIQMGCSLKFLLDWAWSCVVNIKDKLHNTCESLFDWSGQPVSSHSLWSLQHQHHSLVCLKQIFNIFLSLTSPLTETGELELELRLETIKLLLQHYEVLLWCISESLLPEVEEDSTMAGHQFAYPVGELCDANQKRRLNMSKLERVMDDYPLLLVDGLVSCEGNQISCSWETRGGNGLYPPPSMQAAIYMFLLEDISMEVKEAIMLYLLLDLAVVCDGPKENLVTSFIQRFMIPPNFVHKVQGIWFLDHKDYEEGLRQLVTPNVCNQDWTSWIDVAVVNTLLAQDEARTATCFVHSGHSLGATMEERKLMISVLVRNQKVSQAIEFIRRCHHVNEDPGSLMSHLLKECHDGKLIGQLLQLHFKVNEEIHIEKFMRERSDPNSLEPLFLYYLHSSRFLQAFQLNEEMNRMDRMEANLVAQERSANRNRLMNAYLKVLPDITRKMIVEAQQKGPTRPVKRIRVPHLAPLSTVIHKRNQEATSRSTFIMTLMDKVDEVAQVVEDAAEEFPELMVGEDQSDDRFLKTPLTPRHKSFICSPVGDTNLSEATEIRLPPNPLSAAKQRTLMGQEAETTAGYKSLHALTMECLSVLKTPSNDHAHPSPKSTGLASALKTPQSILKIRRITRASFSKDSPSSSQWKRSSPHSRPKRLGFSQSDPSVLSTPSPSSKLTGTIPSAATPKHLRFAGLSPSPSQSVALPFRENSKSLSDDDSQEVWTDAVDVSTDGEEMKSQAKEPVDVTADDKRDKVSEDFTVPLHSHDEGINDHESMDTTPKIPEISSPSVIQGALVIETGSPHERYDDKLGELVRPNLMSPWKHDMSSEEAIDNMEEEEDMEINLNYQETMLPKPDKNFTSVIEKQKINHGPSAPSTKQSRHEINATRVCDEDKATSLVETFGLPINQSLRTEAKALSQTLRIDTSEILSPQQTTSSPERYKREPSSSPATPPSSKMIKMMHYYSKHHQSDKEDIELRPPFLSKESLSSVSRVYSASKEEEGNQTEGISVVEENTSTVEGIDQPVSKVKADTEVEPVEDFVSSTVFLQRIAEAERTPFDQVPSSVSRTKSSSLHPEKSLANSASLLGSEQSSRRVTSSKHSLAVFQEMESLLIPVKSRQSRRGMSKTPERIVDQKEDGGTVPSESVSSAYSLRRSQRHSKTPERITAYTQLQEGNQQKVATNLQTDSHAGESGASTGEEEPGPSRKSQRSQRQSKTPERRLRREKGEMSEPLKQMVEEDKSSTTGLRRSRRLSKTPERGVKKNANNSEMSSASDNEKVATDSSENATKDSGENATKDSSEKATKDSGGKATKDSCEKPTMDSDDKATMDSDDKANDNSEKATMDRSEKAFKDSGEEMEHAVLVLESQVNTVISEVVSMSDVFMSTDVTQVKETSDEEPVIHNLRRSRRQSKTPERVAKHTKIEVADATEGVEVEDSNWQLPKTPDRFREDTIPTKGVILRQSRRQAKTPDRILKQGVSKESFSEKNDVDESSLGSFRHSSRMSKTPERILKRQLHESPGSDEQIETAVMSSRQTRRQSKTPERKMGTASEDTSSENEVANVRRSQRHARTPERLIRSIEGLVRKSNRPQKSPEKLNTPEIETLADTSSSSKRTQHVQDSPATLHRQSSHTSAIKILSPSRKSTRQLKSPERLNTDEIEPVGKNVSPSRSGLSDQNISIKTASQGSTSGNSRDREMTPPGKSSIPKSPSRRGRRVKSKETIDEPKDEDPWREEIPPLQLEIEEDESEISTAVAESPGNRAETSTSFVFSVPASYSTRSHGSNHQRSDEGSGEDSVFLFSSPTSAATATAFATTTTTSTASLTGTSEGDESEESVSQQDNVQERKIVTRRKKKLYQYSPKLLSPLIEQETESKMRTRTRKESTRLSMYQRQGRRSGPLTRRLRPSSKS